MNVTPQKVTNSYEGSEQFLLSVGKAYILEAAMEFWGLKDVNGPPTRHIPPHRIMHMEREKQLEYFDRVIGAFVDEFVIPDHEKENSTWKPNMEIQMLTRLRWMMINTIKILSQTESGIC